MAGRRIVEMVHEDLVLSEILTRRAFENAIRTLAAIGGSTNARPVSQNGRGERGHVGVGPRQGSASFSPAIRKVLPAVIPAQSDGHAKRCLAFHQPTSPAVSFSNGLP
jgi:hypothetical protein